MDPLPNGCRWYEYRADNPVYNWISEGSRGRGFKGSSEMLKTPDGSPRNMPRDIKAE